MPDVLVNIERIAAETGGIRVYVSCWLNNSGVNVRRDTSALIATTDTNDAVWQRIRDAVVAECSGWGVTGGQVILPNFFRAGEILSEPWTNSRVTSDVTNNTTTLADIAGLSMTTQANTNYHIKLVVIGTSTATADWKYQLTHSGTTTRVVRSIRRSVAGVAQAEQVGQTTFDAAAVAMAGTTAGIFTLYEEILLRVGASGGTLKLQFAENTADAGPCTVYEGSYLEYAIT